MPRTPAPATTESALRRELYFFTLYRTLEAGLLALVFFGPYVGLLEAPRLPMLGRIVSTAYLVAALVLLLTGRRGAYPRQALIGVVVGLIVAGVVLYAFFKSDIAAAISERVRAGTQRRKHGKSLGGEWFDPLGGSAGDEPRVAQLEERVDQLHGQVTELAERLDFAERLLAQKRERTLRAGE